MYFHHTDVPPSSTLFTSTTHGFTTLALHAWPMAYKVWHSIILTPGRSKPSSLLLRHSCTNVAVLWCSCMCETRSKCELLRSKGSMCKHAVHQHQSLSRIDQSTAPMFTKHGYCTRMQFLPPETLACMTPRACLATRTIARVGQATATTLTYHVCGT